MIGIMRENECLLCGQASCSPYYSNDPKLLECQFCGIIFLAVDQRNKNIDDYYQRNPFYAHNAKDSVVIYRMEQAANFYLKIINQLKNPPAKLIDVGANWGAFVKTASQAGFQAIGFEKNVFLINIGQDRGIKVLDKDISILGDDSVDLITAFHVLEHLEYPKLFVQEAYSKVKSGGFLVLGVPDIKSYMSRKDKLSWRYIAKEHLFYFSTSSLKNILEAEGFKIVKIKKDHTNLSDQSIKQLLRYLGGRSITRNRFKEKSFIGRTKLTGVSWYKQVIKNIIISLIRVLGRQDFFVMVAQK